MYDIECGIGWKHLYEPLIKMCEERNIKIEQIKEKFGTLRFYVDSAPDDVYDAIDEAERKSEKTCELCGNPGILRNNVLLQTLCDDCHSK